MTRSVYPGSYSRPTLRRLITPRGLEGASPATTAVSYGVVVVACLVTIGPFFYLLSSSLKPDASLFQYPPVWIPSHLYWGNYAHLLFHTEFLRWVANTFLVAGVVTCAKVLFDSMAGYAFAKMRFPFRNALFVVVLMTLMIPFSAILIPLFFIVRDLHLLNTYWALILPPLANPIGIFMMRTFIEGLPSDLENAARLDGASEFAIYWRLILPLVKPGLVVLAVFTFLIQYTSFLWPLVAVSSTNLEVVTVGLAGQSSISQVDYGIYSAGALMALVPITLVFLFLQRFFIAGSLAGALKQ